MLITAQAPDAASLACFVRENLLDSPYTTGIWRDLVRLLASPYVPRAPRAHV